MSSPAAQLALAAALGLVGGAVASWLRVPLAWMLGPLFLCGAAAIAGVPLRPVPWGREIGQAAVGLAIGLRFTPPVLIATAALLPAMVVATIYVVAVTTAAAFLMRRLGGVDHKTAFFATAAAGMADMATVARERGGDPSAVAVVHAIRVAAVVFVVPLIVFAVGETGTVLTPDAVATTNWPVLVLLMALGTGAALILRPLPVPNPWLIGPILVGMATSAFTGLSTAVPNLVVVLAQLLIGIALGTRFQRKLLLSLPRVVAAALAVAAVLIAAAAGGGAVLSLATGLPFATSFLAVAPAGVTEMVLTAKVMQLDTASVTAFHVMRIGVIAATILLTFGLYERVVRRIHGSRV
ncbi:MAG TPA: AbrB family transcriptional regulator [Beijerinckiaceae bacterium]|nr:AbrB family transcriptional regulator [Beijerinckiaceae bacterium]